MTKPHAQRIAIATGLDLAEVHEYLEWDGPFESTQEAISHIEYQETLRSAWDTAESSGIPFDHVMGAILGA